MVFCKLRIILERLSWKIMGDITYSYNRSYIEVLTGGFDQVINGDFAIASISNLRIQTR